MSEIKTLNVQPGGPCPDFEETICECILVDKVYDFCIKRVEDTVCTNPITVPCVEGTFTGECECEVTSGPTCELISSVPLDPPEGNLRVVTFKVEYTVTFYSLCEVTNTTTTINRNEVATESRTLFKQVVICAPDEEVCSISCLPYNVEESCSVIQPDSETQEFIFCCNVFFCLDIQSTCVVKLLVPTFGFCVPSECEQPLGDLCPTTGLFPEQCLPLDSQTQGVKVVKGAPKGKKRCCGER